MPKRLARHYWIRLQRAFRRLARARGTSHQIAFGVAIGMVVGMTPTVGLQMLIAAGIATLLKANRLAAILPVWVTNPATIVPIYSFNYWLGRGITGGPGLEVFWEKYNAVIAASQQGGFFQGIKNATLASLEIGIEIQLPLWTGCFLVGFFCAVPSYILTDRAVIRMRERRERKRQERHDRVTRIIYKAPLPEE